MFTKSPIRYRSGDEPATAMLRASGVPRTGRAGRASLSHGRSPPHADAPRPRGPAALPRAGPTACPRPAHPVGTRAPARAAA
ncbi:hypothetical protein BF93_18175 [Brachybacterium phenoliresistens]|uniref:Uncharacterized protein n=1 Tax=Brachybacterium phenoliresistens TaxID=396014 RepID=Z9JTI1_9MICO|nr:hypothetical protein BF93_18175 [Brachybacterium phenoliresistens]